MIELTKYVIMFAQDLDENGASLATGLEAAETLADELWQHADDRREYLPPDMIDDE